jgi:hypothetical protein
MNNLLKKIYDLLCEIHTKSFMQPFPFKAGLFNEIDMKTKLDQLEQKSEELRDPN